MIIKHFFNNILHNFLFSPNSKFIKLYKRLSKTFTHVITER